MWKSLILFFPLYEAIQTWKGWDSHWMPTRLMPNGGCEIHPCIRGLCLNSSSGCERFPGVGGARNEVNLSTFFWTHDPFANLTLEKEDLHGWFGANIDFWPRLLHDFQPRTFVEVGVWKGLTALHVAKEMKIRLGGGLVLAVDTWLGAVEFWTEDPKSDFGSRDLHFQNGYPTIQRRFISNVVHQGLQAMVIPLPLPSVLAAKLLIHKRMEIDMVHIDGSHEYEDVIADIQAWWPLLSKGGVLVGDDYMWPSVRLAADEFVKSQNLSLIVDEGQKNKWYVIRQD